jgi:hypothetical protein
MEKTKFAVNVLLPAIVATIETVSHVKHARTSPQTSFTPPSKVCAIILDLD